MSEPSEPQPALNQHQVRRYAMQLLYQFDLRGTDDAEAFRQDVADDAESQPIADAAFQLAQRAWESREKCDPLTTEIAPDWPAHRQPPLDRALLRLAYYEITSGRTQFKIVISEAVNLAKEFCAERSASFINGVLDKLVKRIDLPEVSRQPATTLTESGDPWLDDAMKNDQSS